jgi:hypothetical protein
MQILVGHRTETGCDCARLADKQIRPGETSRVGFVSRGGTNFSSVTRVEVQRGGEQGFRRRGRAQDAPRRLSRATVTDMDETDPVYDTENPTDDGEHWDDDEERYRE